MKILHLQRQMVALETAMAGGDQAVRQHGLSEKGELEVVQLLAAISNYVPDHSLPKGIHELSRRGAFVHCEVVTEEEETRRFVRIGMSNMSVEFRRKIQRAYLFMTEMHELEFIERQLEHPNPGDIAMLETADVGMLV